MVRSDPNLAVQIPLPPAELVPVTSYVTSTIASLILGLTFSVILYGMSLVQVQVYILRYHRADRAANKIMVAVLWALDTLSIILVARSLYHIVVLQYGNPVQAAIIPWSLIAESETVGIITFLAHLFFTLQIFRANGARYLSAAILLLSLGAFFGDMIINIHTLLEPSRDTLAQPKMIIYASIVQALLVMTDISITTSLVRTFYGWSSKSISSITTDSVRSLVIYALSRGIVSCLCQILLLVIYAVYPNEAYWLPFHMISGRLYVNSVLAALNARYRMNKRENNIELFPEHSTIAFRVKDPTSFIEDSPHQFNISVLSPDIQGPSSSSSSSSSAAAAAARAPNAS